jgi:hypothetical protein
MLLDAPEHAPLSLCIGTITSNPAMLAPLLRGLQLLATDPAIAHLVVVVLDNASPSIALRQVVGTTSAPGLAVTVISMAQQRLDAARGAFGRALRERPDRQVGIAATRTMLQRYLGVLLESEPNSVGWLLDDDMRVDDRARWYLPWLPAFRDKGTDVLIGTCDGASPNPPLHGVQGQLYDLLHNLMWLQSLPNAAGLPDRSAENTVLREKFPDYYYDLSRKHTAHLEAPFWIEPLDEKETVADAYARLINGAPGLLRGAPFTRPLVTTLPVNPLVTARDCVNRGGNTFILDHRALTQTPNLIPQIQGHEARRSDMMWAIVNRYYRRMTIKTVAFPVLHVGCGGDTPNLDVTKIQGEIVGSALYAALTEFLADKPRHALNFCVSEAEAIWRRVVHHRDQRLGALWQSFARIATLREALRRVVKTDELDELFRGLAAWLAPSVFEQIRVGVGAHERRDIQRFIISLRRVADDYARALHDRNFIERIEA